jgi:NADH:ubiquinone oxidoreductase subunit
MPQSVRIGRLQYRSAVAIDHDGRKRRRIIFEPGMAMTVPVASMGVMHAGMMMPSRIGDVAGDSQRGDDRSTR